MKKQDIVVGGTYTAKVSGGIALVRITDERWIGDEHKGWRGVNTATGRAVTIKSAQRLRAAVGGKADVPARSPDVAPGGEGAAKVVAVARSPKPPKGGAKGGKAPKATGGQKADAKAAKPEAKKAPAKAAKEKKTNGPMSGLDAAAKVLADAGKAMNLKDIMAAVFKRKLWASEGATPEATVSAAIGREIRAKGSDSRFKKAGRGLFAAAGKGA